MAEPALVADCVAAMKAAVKIPVTVKCRIGIDEQDPDAGAVRVCRSGQGGRRRCADRARAQGLAERPVAAREPRGAAARLCASCIGSRRRIPIFEIVLNGGIASARAGAGRSLAHVDGVMMGRAAYQEPWRLLAVDPLLFGEPAPFASPKEAALALIPYIERETRQGRAAACHHPPRAWPVPRGAGRARLPPASGDRGGQARRRRGRHG